MNEYRFLVVQGFVVGIGLVGRNFRQCLRDLGRCHSLCPGTTSDIDNRGFECQVQRVLREHLQFIGRGRSNSSGVLFARRQPEVPRIRGRHFAEKGLRSFQPTH